ncbi:MAG: MlaD family protein [Brevinematales bacterium]|jgi:ABC-type transporter Mla subunit MlaD
MPFTFKSAQKAVSAFVLIGIFLFISVLFLVGKGSDLFTIKDSYITQFDDGYGLGSGSPIKYKSINIGKIKDVVLTEDGHIKVSVWFNEEYRYLLRQDSVLKVQSSIIGSASLVLVPSSDTNSPLLIPGSLILSSDMDEGRKILEVIAERTPIKKDDINAMAQKILGNIDKMEPVINGTMLNLRSITAEARDMLSNINSPDTSIGAIIHDKKNLSTKIDSMVDSLDSTLKGLKSATGNTDDMKSIVILLKENLIELKGALSGIKNLLGGEKTTDQNIKPGERL